MFKDIKEIFGILYAFQDLIDGFAEGFLFLKYIK